MPNCRLSTSFHAKKENLTLSSCWKRVQHVTESTFCRVRDFLIAFAGKTIFKRSTHETNAEKQSESSG